MAFKMSKESELLYKGSKPVLPVENPDSPPIYQFTATAVTDMDDYDFADAGGKYYYNRTKAPNRDMLAEAVSFLEGGEETLITSSGMAAISTTLFSLLKSGDHIVTTRSIYGETIALMDEMLTGFGITTDYADFSDLEDVKAHITPDTKVLYTEIVSNPLIQVVDIDALCALAKEHGILVVVDNTFTTPLAIRPLEHGADVVVHSMTKFFGGHNDLTGGCITTSAEILKKMILPYWFLGACMDPNTAWLMLRSVRTMKLRVEKQMANAAKLAAALDADPRVEHVNHPTMPYHPQHDLAMKIMPNGSGPMLSFKVADDRDKVNEFIRELSMVQYLGTLGGYRTSLAHPVTAFKSEFSMEELHEMGLTEGLIRISVGTEEIEDIVGDITNALKVFD